MINMGSTSPLLLCRSCITGLRFMKDGIKILSLNSHIFDRCYTTGTFRLSSQPDGGNKPTSKAITISKSMQAYLEHVKAHDDMMKAEVADFEIGKRHLANIMGEDPDSFTQQDVDRAIEYLLPSGIFDRKARPMLKDPYEIFPKRKAAQFGLDGKPYHWMYFTTLPNYYNVLHEITWKLEDLKSLEDNLRSEGKFEEEAKQLNLGGSKWLPQTSLKDRFVENIQDKEYKHFVVMMDRLVSHPLAYREEAFIMEYRIDLSSAASVVEVPEAEVDSDGRLMVSTEGTRKNSKASVKVYKPGTGTFTINGNDLRYFNNFLYRETLLFPLTLTNLIGDVDVVANVKDGGPTGQAGAIRYAVSKALSALVSDDVREQMRLAGLLTRDPRKRERKKVGQAGARKKFTWKRR